MAFKEGVTPFVRQYCTSCHDNRKSKAGLNPDAALKLVENSWSNNVWKLAVAKVKPDDMPPDEASDFPSNEERWQFIEWIGKIKYLRQAGRAQTHRIKIFHGWIRLMT